LIEFKEMSGHDIKQVNTQSDGSVAPKDGKTPALGGGNISAELAPLSWNMIRVAVK